MRKDEKSILLILFCAGVLGGLLFPRWLGGSVKLSLGILNRETLEKFAVLKTGTASVWKSTMQNRLTLMLLLYFSAYTAAGFWIFVCTSLLCGASLGFLTVLSILHMRYWGLLFLFCALMPQWLLYLLAGDRMAAFLIRRKERAAYCAGGAAPSYYRKVILDFLQILLLTCCGAAAEAYLNPWLLQNFLKLYLS